MNNVKISINSKSFSFDLNDFVQWLKNNRTYMSIAFSEYGYTTPLTHYLLENLSEIDKDEEYYVESKEQIQIYKSNDDEPIIVEEIPEDIKEFLSKMQCNYTLFLKKQDAVLSEYDIKS